MTYIMRKLRGDPPGNFEGKDRIMGQVSGKDARKFERDMKRQRRGSAFVKLIGFVIGLAVLYWVYTHFIAG